MGKKQKKRYIVTHEKKMETQNHNDKYIYTQIPNQNNLTAMMGMFIFLQISLYW